MKKLIFIASLAIFALFSCSKDKPLTPINGANTADSQMIKTSSGNNEVFVVTDDKSNDDGITDPDKENKEKTNKNAKN